MTHNDHIEVTFAFELTPNDPQTAPVPQPGITDMQRAGLVINVAAAVVHALRETGLTPEGMPAHIIRFQCYTAFVQPVWSEASHNFELEIPAHLAHLPVPD